jgi:hypothetical protein
MSFYSMDMVAGNVCRSCGLGDKNYQEPGPRDMDDGWEVAFSVIYFNPGMGITGPRPPSFGDGGLE